MNTDEIRHALRVLPQFYDVSMDGAEVRTNQFSTIAKFRASSVDFADITAFTIVRLEVALYRCVKS